MAIKKHLAVTSLLGASFAALGQESFIVEDLKVEGLQRVALGAALTGPLRIGAVCVCGSCPRTGPPL